MNKIKLKLYISLLVAFIFTSSLSAQVIVERSKDRVIIGGTAYYIHIVDTSQTLYSISRAYNVSTETITRENPSAVYGLRIGQALKIPVVEEEEDAGPFRIAVVMPSAINDLAFSQSMYDALLMIQEWMGGEEAMTFDYSDGMFVVDDAAAAIRDYAAQGYDLVIAHGSQYGGPLQEIAPDFPDTTFAWGTSDDTFGLDNVYASTTRSDEGGYVNGIMAGLITETGVIGVVGPIEVVREIEPATKP